jgi:CheY-like chemotaxis protein
MPGMDGFDLARKVKELPDPWRPVIMMLTSGEQRGDVARCHELGVSAYLTKPVRRAELRTSMMTALASVSGRNLEAKPSPQQAGNRKAHGGSDLNILLVEDNPVNQRLAVRILEREGYHVVVAGNGREAVARWGTRSFDAILMDIQMPEMDGIQATSAIREAEKRTGAHIPIIAMTAHAMSGDRELCLGAGADDYISKPISARALVDMIEKSCKATALV